MKKKFGVVLVALIVVVGGIFYAQYKVQIEAMSTEVLLEEIALSLSELKEDIEKIEIEDSNNLVLEMKEGTWQNPLEPEITYNDEIINEWINYFKTETSINIIRNVKDTSIYGISDTTPKIVLYDKSGKSQTFRLGNVNAENTMRYIYCDETELVYSVSPLKSQILEVSTDKLIDRQITMPNLEKITSIVIGRGEETFNLQKVDEKWLLQDCYKESYEVKAEVMVGLLETLQNLEKERFVGKVTPERSYGVSMPSLSITLDHKYTLNLGDKIDGEWSFSENDSPYVYAVLAENMKAFEQLKPLQMIHRSVYRPAEEEIESIVMTNPQAVYELTFEEAVEEVTNTDEAQQEVTEETQEEAKEVENASEVATTHLVGVLNEQLLDRAKTESLLNLIEESTAIEKVLQNPEIEQKTERKAEVSIVYYMKDGTEKHIEFISYDTNYYILRVDGHIEFAANKEKVTTLFSELGKLVKDVK